MSPLRQRMLDALQLRGMAKRTQEAYIDAVARLARHHRCSPDKLDSQQVQTYLLHLLRARGLSRSTVNQAGCAFRFLYGTVLGRSEVMQIPLGAPPQCLPEVLSREELARLFECAPHLKARTFLMTAYGSALALERVVPSAGDRHRQRTGSHVPAGSAGQRWQRSLCAVTFGSAGGVADLLAHGASAAVAVPCQP